jgi:hypothetical protein
MGTTNMAINFLVIFACIFVMIGNYSDARKGAIELYHDAIGE